MKKNLINGLALLIIVFAAANALAGEERSSASLAEIQHLLRQEQANEALDLVQKLLQADPENAEYHAWHGNILGAMSNKATDMMKMAEYGMAAFAAFERAIQLDPENITGRLGRGIANLMAPPPFGSLGNALIDLTKVVELDERNAEGRFYLGLLYKKREDPAKARSEFQKALALDPGHAAAKRELAALAELAPPQAATATSSPCGSSPLAIANVTIIDVANGRKLPNMTVLIKDGRIEKIAASSAATVPADYSLVDGRGQFLLPGLWDMHMHIIGEPMLYFPLFLANGVTGIRYMGGTIMPGEWRTLQEKIAAGQIPGPRVYAGSPILDGPKPAWPGSIAVADAEAGKRIAAEMKEQGAEFLKVYTFLPRDAYRAIGETANKLGIPFDGHVPLLVSIQEAIRSGQRCIEHLDGILPAASRRCSELEALQDAGDTQALIDSPAFSTMLEDYDESRAEELFAAMKERMVWQVPTLQVFHGLLLQREPGNSSPYPESKYVSPLLRNFFGWQLPDQDPARTRRERQYFAGWLSRAKRIVLRLQRLGVPLLAGTDTPYVNCVPGFSLHEELRLLVAAGLTPLQALQAATIHPARFMGRSSDLGTVETGKCADLLLLAADPLHDIANTRRITAVIFAGRLLTAEQIQASLSELENRIVTGN